jgi:hypothetical protein
VENRLVGLEVAPLVGEALAIEEAADDLETLRHPFDLLCHWWPDRGERRLVQ